MYPVQTSGVSNEAFMLEVKHCLWESDLTKDQCQKLVRVLCEEYNFPELPVTATASRTRKNGITLYGSYLGNKIHLGKYGKNIATVVHEFAHHILYRSNHMCIDCVLTKGHCSVFQETHVKVINKIMILVSQGYMPEAEKPHATEARLKYQNSEKGKAARQRYQEKKKFEKAFVSAVQNNSLTKLLKLGYSEREANDILARARK